jgi:cell division protein FtsL
MSAAASRSYQRNNRNAKAKARNRIRDARLALIEPAHVIAERARARYEKVSPARLPSKKPHLVKTQSRQDRSFIWVMRLFAFGVVVSLFVVVAIQTSIAERQITIDNIRAQQKKEVTQFEKTRQDVADLKSPDRITRRAQYLGLVQPARFVSVSIPMSVTSRTDQEDDKLWREVKAIINVTS